MHRILSWWCGILEKKNLLWFPWSWEILQVGELVELIPLGGGLWKIKIPAFWSSNIPSSLGWGIQISAAAIHPSISPPAAEPGRRRSMWGSDPCLWCETDKAALCQHVSRGALLCVPSVPGACAQCSGGALLSLSPYARLPALHGSAMCSCSMVPAQLVHNDHLSGEISLESGKWSGAYGQARVPLRQGCWSAQACDRERSSSVAGGSQPGDESTAPIGYLLYGSLNNLQHMWCLLIGQCCAAWWGEKICRSVRGP